MITEHTYIHPHVCTLIIIIYRQASQLREREIRLLTVTSQVRTQFTDKQAHMQCMLSAPVSLIVSLYERSNYNCPLSPPLHILSSTLFHSSYLSNASALFLLLNAPLFSLTKKFAIPNFCKVFFVTVTTTPSSPTLNVIIIITMALLSIVIRHIIQLNGIVRGRTPLSHHITFKAPIITISFITQKTTIA